MQFAAAIALAVSYVGLTLAWGGVHPRNGMPWWWIAPFIVTFCTALVAAAVSAVLPKPWTEGRRYGLPPRRVYLSWRSAFRIPALLPMLVFLYYFHWGLSLHFDIGWVGYFVAALAAVGTSFAVRKRRREFSLLRNGEMVMGVVDARENLGGGPDRISYHFTTAGGTMVSGRGRDVGYGVVDGSFVPVFCDACDPRNHVVACGCWFEAD